MDKSGSLLDRIIAVLTYFTFGMAGVIWLIASYFILNKKNTSFLKFHIFQSIFVAVILCVINLIFQIGYSFTVGLPLIGKIVKRLALFIVGDPYHFTFSLWHLLIFILVLYLSIGALMGKRSYLPHITEAINSNFGN